MNAFDTALGKVTTATLTVARLGRLPGATAIVVYLLEYGVDPRKILAAVEVEALDEYVAWLEEEEGVGQGEEGGRSRGENGRRGVLK